MHASDTYLAILEEGQEKATREDILVVGEVRLGPANEAQRWNFAGQCHQRDRHYEPDHRTGEAAHA